MNYLRRYLQVSDPSCKRAVVFTCEPLDSAKIQQCVDTTYNVPSDRNFIIRSCEGTWYVSSIEHYKIKYNHWVLSRFFSACAWLSNSCRVSSRFFLIQALKFEIAGCQNLLILCSFHNGCLYIIEPKRRTWSL